jgi:hypothetical protein
MTKATLPFTFTDAAKRTIARIADAELERLFGRSWRSTADAWRNADNPRWPRVDQALALDLAYAAAGGDGSPFLDAFQVAVSVASIERDACRTALATTIATLAKDSGELLAASIAVIHPDATQREVDRALVEAQDVVTGADSVVRQLKSFSRRGAGSRPEKAGGSR